ncbi:hypothetical protein MFIFM68171_10459 [Madurella fahalii]|uniref:Subtelomeric hrmA-associated cluster protein AFUB-079030/YDR124W-like helical bundle domain-containing protein n=1 Tax=Madurella fahalii TaxID=1157608 RepID=A0ABQ0GR85_9PEZI
MVNILGATGHRSSYSGQQWDGYRPATEQVPDDGSLLVAEPARDSPPSTVARALREQCHIDYENFFLAVSLKNGQVVYFSGPQPLAEDEIRSMFRRDKFLQYQPTDSNLGDNSYHMETPQSGHYADNRSNRGTAHFENRSSATSRRRRRQGGSALRRELDDDVPPVVTPPKRPLRIGDSKAVWDFYDHRFRCIQQTTCKHIGKAFVKAIAPRKQATHPYTKGDATAPGWWPKPWGPGEKDKVRHVEPDHQLKPERVHLLVHILKLVVEPHEKQHPDIQKVDVNVAKLECITMEQLSTWFADRNTNNARKKPILQEIFKVAKMEEKYKRNEIDANTQVYVMADDMVQDYSPSDVEDDDCGAGAGAGDGFTSRLKDERERPGSASDASSRVSPVNSTIPHPMLPSPSNGHGLNPNVHTASFISPLSIRDNQYSPAAIMSAEQYTYAEGGNMTAGGQAPLQAHTAALQMQDILSSPHENGRRSSLLSTPLSTPSEFTSLSPPAMYPTNIGWQSQQHQSSSTASGTSPLYAVGTQAAHHHQVSLPLPPLQQQEQQYGSSGFDGLSHHHHDLFRSSGVPQNPAVVQGGGHQGYGGYYSQHQQHGGQLLPSVNGGIKAEPALGSTRTDDSRDVDMAY